MGALLNRRRVMGGATAAADYIQDGLIFQLDGIDKGDDDSAWTDLIGGAKFTYVDGVTSVNNGVVFATGHEMFKCNKSDINWPFISCTLEVCLSENNKGMILFDSRQGMISLGYYVRTLMFGHFNTSGVSYDYNNIASSLSINHVQGFQNGIDITRTHISYWGGGGNGITIGSRGAGNSYPFVGTIYAIRVYNRQLTADEMLNNQRVDNARFNLGLTI